MEVTVKKEFRDKYNGNLYKAGEKVDFTQKRIKEINSVDKSLIEVNKTPKEEEKGKQKRGRNPPCFEKEKKKRCSN